MNQLSSFTEFLNTGQLGTLTDQLTLSEALAKLGIPDGKDVHDEIPSPFTGELIVHRNLYYGDLLLAFFGQQLYQYNFEVRYQTAKGLPIILKASWYKQISHWNPDQLKSFLQQINLVSRCYRIIDQFLPHDEKLVIVVDCSKLYWFFDNRQLYKVSWKFLHDDEEHFFAH